MSTAVQLPDAEHLSRPWRIHELVGDFRLEDAWALPTPGGPDDFPQLVEGFSRADPTQMPSRLAAGLWALRFKVGSLLGWDGEDSAPGAGVASLRDRLPADLRDGPTGPEFDLPFDGLYLLEREWAGEIANKTMHGVMHLSWVPDSSGPGFHGVMAVYVKPNGRLGDAYMAVIRPFRHHVVYPPLMRLIERSWLRRGSAVAA